MIVYRYYWFIIVYFQRKLLYISCYELFLKMVSVYYSGIVSSYDSCSVFK